MPYLSPTLTTPSLDEHRVAKAGGHRRSRSLNQTFSADRGPGAFSPLMGLPRRTTRHSGAKKSPIFQLADSDDETSHRPDPDPHNKDSDVSGGLLGLSGLDVSKEPTAVPFPCLSPEVIDSQHSPFVFPPPTDIGSHPWSPSEPSERAPDSPIIRKSNGQLLKPSLKSSYSSGNLPSLASASAPRPFTRSAPSTPSTKAVHFAEKDGVVVFEKSQRPVAVSLGGSAKGDETETENETDRDVGPTSYPFPPMSNTSSSAVTRLALSSATSQIPAFPLSSLFKPDSPDQMILAAGHVYLEALVFSPSGPPMLRGSVVVRNVCFTKQVYVRFTLDDWQTTSEVGCTYSASLPTPSHVRSFSVPNDLGRDSAPKWDRFNFVIKLEDVERNLEKRKMFMVVRYYAPEAGSEFWDNNNGKNYLVGFEKKVLSSKPISPSTSMVGGSNSHPVSLPLPILHTTSASMTRSHSHPGGSHSAPTTTQNSPQHSPTSGLYPRLNLRLVNYASPSHSRSPSDTNRLSSVISPPLPKPSVPIPSASKNGNAPSSQTALLSPPSSPLNASPIGSMELVGGHLATPTRENPFTPPVAPSPASPPKQSIGVANITPPHSAQHSPEQADIPLPPSPPESMSSDDDVPIATALSRLTCRGSPPPQRVVPSETDVAENVKLPSSGENTPPQSVPVSTSTDIRKASMALDSRGSFDNAPPEFLQRFCFFGSAPTTPDHVTPYAPTMPAASPGTWLSPYGFLRPRTLGAAGV